MDAVLAAMEGTAVAEYLRVSRWGYAALNTAHIIGIALLVGSTVTLNLRFLGVWAGIQRRTLVTVLVPVAAAGLSTALVTGLLLFSVRAQEYAGIGFLQTKLVLVAAGVLSAAGVHRAYGFTLAGASDRRLAVHAVISILCWLGALTCGRLIAFADT